MKKWDIVKLKERNKRRIHQEVTANKRNTQLVEVENIFDVWNKIKNK